VAATASNGTRNVYGIARTLLLGLAALLILGISASVVMGIRARNDARDQTIDQATAIADNSLTLVFKPDDTALEADAERAARLSEKVQAVVIDPSPFDAVTLWSPAGEILYSSDEGRIGNDLVGEQKRVRAAIRGVPQTATRDGVFTVMLPMRFPSGVGTAAAVELGTSADPIAAAAGPWNTNILFLAVGLAMVIGLLVVVHRLSILTATSERFTQESGRANAVVMAPGTPLVSPGARAMAERAAPALREEQEARRRAEDRARSSEDRLAQLNDQYRKTLEELHAAQRHLKEQMAAPRSDPRTAERLVEAEQRLRTLEDQVRAAQADRERWTAERAAIEAERAALTEERDALSRQVSERTAASANPDQGERLRQAEAEAIRLRAELEGAQTQLTLTERELEAIKGKAGASRELQDDLDAAQVEILRTREEAETAVAEAEAARDLARAAKMESEEIRTKLESAQAELRGMKAEGSKAGALGDELRAARAEIDALKGAHRAELLQREADFEATVQATREQFQSQLQGIEKSFREQLTRREQELGERLTTAETEARAAAVEMEAAQSELQAARDELASERAASAKTTQEIARTREAAEAVQRELAVRAKAADDLREKFEAVRAELETQRAAAAQTEEGAVGLQAQIEAERSANQELLQRAERAERDARTAARQADQIERQLEEAAADNAELNRRLQEIEARRALELADADGRADIDELLRVTQERLAGQTEKLMAAEDRLHETDRALAASRERVEEVEAALRQHQMSESLRQIRGEGGQPEDEAVDPGVAEAAVIEDRRASSPFLKELSLDANKSISKIMGITQILKHKKDAKEQAQLIKQLTMHARRLDHTVRDLSDADQLARGTIDLQVQRTDLEPLVERVITETGISSDHDVRIETEKLVVGVDRMRTEQILTGLIRNAGDRTPTGKTIVVRLTHADGGALISVEDTEASSDASMSPVVRRFAEAQGGWAKVESREGGGSSFRVFLPDASPERPAEPEAPTDAELQIVVDDELGGLEPGEFLVQELHRLSELGAGED
jgi:hypothetical protein